jgi:3-hydroxymyristoyl/3-hydroxydecanoyl-(acyl carrier protein) dehydratase
MNMDRLILADEAYFEGHFPGQPILPGVTQIALVAQAILRDAGLGMLRAIHHVRLRQLVRPGETLALSTHRIEADGVRFELRRGDMLVTNGALAIGEAPVEWGGGVRMQEMAAIETPPIDQLLPHRAPMQFVQRVLHREGERIMCSARIPAACPLVRNGHAPAILAVEAAAQAAGVREALARLAAGRPDCAPRGYLVSLRDVEFAAGTLPADVPFVVTVRLQSVSLPLSTYAIEAGIMSQPVLRGTIGTFLAEA